VMVARFSYDHTTHPGIKGSPHFQAEAIRTVVLVSLSLHRQ
jgi:hypothetical protein